MKSDGSVFVGGRFNRVGGSVTVGLAQINADGTTTSFNADLEGPGKVTVLSPQSDGKLLIGGDFLKVNGVERFNIARLNADGTTDLSFNAGAGPDGDVVAIHEQTDGKILVGGEFTFFNDVLNRGIVRLNSDGSEDVGFATVITQEYADDGAYNFYVQEDGKIVIGGGFLQINGTDRKHFARLNADGTLDATFNSSDDVTSRIRDVEQLADGNYIIGGYNSNENGFLSLRNGDGSALSAFDNNHLDLPAIRDVEIFEDGKILVGGLSFGAGEHFVKDQHLVRFNPNGTIDHSFEMHDDAIVEALEIFDQNHVIASIGPNFGGPYTLTRFNGLGDQDQGAPLEIDGNILEIYLENNTGYFLGDFTSIGEMVTYGISKFSWDVLNPPSDLALNGTEEVTLTWTDNASDETGFEVFRSTFDNSNFVLLANLPANSQSFIDNDIDPTSQYFYKVRSLSQDQFSVFSEVVAFPEYELKKPIKFRLESVTTNSVSLAWESRDINDQHVLLIREEAGMDDVTYVISQSEFDVYRQLSKSRNYLYIHLGKYKFRFFFRTNRGNHCLNTGERPSEKRWC